VFKDSYKETNKQIKGQIHFLITYIRLPNGGGTLKGENAWPRGIVATLGWTEGLC